MDGPVRILNMFTIMNRGGAETMVMNYYRKIDRNKVQFDFLVHRDEKGAYEDEIKALGGRIYRMIPIYPQNFKKYKKLLESFFDEHREYKIIHSHMSELGYFAFREAKIQGIPIRICHAHNSPHGFDLKMIMRTYLKRKMIPFVTHMFTCGEESAEWLYGKKYRNQFIQLNNAIDTKNFIFNKNIESNVRKELNIENKFVVGHVGRFCEQKNHKRLISLFYEIQKLKSDSILVLIGKGDLEIGIKKQIENLGITNKVIFLGLKSDVYRYMQAFDIFLFPSLFEGLPVTMVEAQAAGLQCFISDRIPLQCVITNNVELFSLDEKDQIIVSRIIELHKGYKRKDMSKEIIKSGFDIEENVKWLEDFYINEYNKYK